MTNTIFSIQQSLFREYVSRQRLPCVRCLHCVNSYCTLAMDLYDTVCFVGRSWNCHNFVFSRNNFRGGTMIYRISTGDFVLRTTIFPDVARSEYSTAKKKYQDIKIETRFRSGRWYRLDPKTLSCPIPVA